MCLSLYFNCTYFPSTYLEDPRDELLGLLLFLSAKDGGGDRLTACEDSLTTGWAVVDRFSAVLFIEEDRFWWVSDFGADTAFTDGGGDRFLGSPFTDVGGDLSLATVRMGDFFLGSRLSGGCWSALSLQVGWPMAARELIGNEAYRNK